MDPAIVDDALALKWHPDRTHSSSSEEFQLIKRAYDVLYDPAARKVYDNVLAKLVEQNKETLFNFCVMPFLGINIPSWFPNCQAYLANEIEKWIND